MVKPGKGRAPKYRKEAHKLPKVAPFSNEFDQFLQEKAIDSAFILDICGYWHPYL